MNRAQVIRAVTLKDVRDQRQPAGPAADADCPAGPGIVLPGGIIWQLRSGQLR